jgi:type-F conjugative transfer system pilin assembly protein TrbC
VRFNLISYVIIILLIAFDVAAAPTTAATESGNAISNSQKDGQYLLTSQASAEDIKWASDLAGSSLEMVWQNLRDKFEQQQKLEAKNAFKVTSDSNGLPSGLARQFTGLYIFVSSSMPKPLLKAYLQSASKYGGVLVFKGLPDGSFQELAKLVLELTSDQNDGQELAASMQIDDEAYQRFQVTTVPTIVLSQAGDYHPNQPAILKFDKMVGNVGVKYALAEFARYGDLVEQALECLK